MDNQGTPGAGRSVHPLSRRPRVLLLTTRGMRTSLYRGGPDGSLIMQPSLLWPERFACRAPVASVLSLVPLIGKSWRRCHRARPFRTGRRFDPRCWIFSWQSTAMGIFALLFLVR